MPLRKRGGKFHYRFEVDGKTYQGPTGLKAIKHNKTAAAAVEARARELVMSGQGLQLKVEAEPFNEAARKFLEFCDGEYRAHPNTALRFHTSFSTLVAFFKATPVRSLRRADVQNYKSWRAKNGIKDITIRHDLHNLSKGFQFFVTHNWARVNPVQAEDIPSDADAVRMNILTAEDERLYFSEAWTHPGLYDSGKLIRNQGCRPDEIMSLQVTDIDLVKRTLTVRRGKSRAARRTLLLTPESFEIVARRVREAPGAWLFPGAKPGTRCTQLNAVHDRALERLAVCECTHRKKEHRGGRRHNRCHCGCEAFSEVSRLAFVIYDLRHTFATRHAEAGMPVASLAAILGHGDLRSVSKYVHTTQHAMDQAMLKFGGAAVEAAQEGARLQ